MSCSKCQRSVGLKERVTTQGTEYKLTSVVQHGGLGVDNDHHWSRTGMPTPKDSALAAEDWVMHNDSNAFSTALTWEGPRCDRTVYMAL